MAEVIGPGITVMVLSEESTLTLMYQSNVSYDGAEVQCIYGDYNESLELGINDSTVETSNKKSQSNKKGTASQQSL